MQDLFCFWYLKRNGLDGDCFFAHFGRGAGTPDGLYFLGEGLCIKRVPCLF